MSRKSMCELCGYEMSTWLSLRLLKVDLDGERMERRVCPDCADAAVKEARARFRVPSLKQTEGGQG